MSNSNRLSLVDVAKGIGIVLVVYGHVARGVFNAGIFIENDLYELVDSVIYSFHMPLFFFISGLFFLSSLNKDGGHNFIFKKIDVIVYPYVIWSILQGGIEVVMSNYTNGNVKIIDVFSLFWQPHAQFWYLYALFFVFCLSVLVYQWQEKPYLALVSFFCAILYFLHYSGAVGGRLFGYVSDNMIFFTWGVLVGRKGLKLFQVSRSILFLFFIVFVFSQFVFHVVLGLRYTDGGVFHLINAAISISFVMAFSCSLSFGGFNWLGYVGSSSMVIYLMHILVGSGSRIILSKLFYVDNAIVHLVFGTLAGVFVPLVFVRLVGKNRLKFLFSPPKLVSFERG